jgi:hypothetical protein
MPSRSVADGGRSFQYLPQVESSKLLGRKIEDCVLASFEQWKVSNPETAVSVNDQFSLASAVSESQPAESSVSQGPSVNPSHTSNTTITGEEMNTVILGKGTVVERTPVASQSHFPCTDSGNAEMFAAIHGENVLFDHKRGRWLIWDPQNQRWSEDKQAQVRSLMKETARARLKHAPTPFQDSDRHFKWARHSESRSSIDSALELAKSERPISDSGDGWDSDPWLLGLADCVVDLLTGIARPATRSDKVTRFSPVNYERTATCPRFEQFISEVFAGNSELIGYIQKAIGYSLTGSVGEQCLFACHGDGRNGKSTLLEVLLHILGDYAIDLPFSVLEAKTNGNPPGEGVNLPGTRFAKVVEIREGRRLDEARIKSWTGGDTMTVRPLYRNAFSFHPTHKLWLAFNHKPVAEHLNGRKAGRVFQTRNGTPLSKDNVRRKLAAVLVNLGLKHGGLHAFRHGRVSVLQQNGVPGDLVKEWIGHSNLRTTSRYTHFGPEIRERIAAQLGILKPMLDPIGPNLNEVEVHN